MVKEGDRIEVTHVARGDPGMEVGDTGVVDDIDFNRNIPELGRQVWVKWDSGGYSALLEDDNFKIVEVDG